MMKLFPLKKQASLTGIATGLAVAEGTAQSLSLLGRNRGSNLFGAGVELGSKGEKMNPYTETLAKNLFGKKQVLPYEAGMQVGSRMKQMEPEKQERFLNKVVGMGSARKDRLELETGKRVKDPILNALEDYQIGKDRKNGLFQSIITKGSKPENAPSSLANLAANISTVPTAVIDSRFAIRPALRAAEQKPTVINTQKKLFPEGTKREKVYGAVRNYID